MNFYKIISSKLDSLIPVITLYRNSSEYMIQEAYEIISDCNTSQRNFVTKCQLQLWKSHTSSEIRLGLWINKFKDSNSYVRSRFLSLIYF